jgi:hypothetical protein
MQPDRIDVQKQLRSTDRNHVIINHIRPGAGHVGSFQAVKQ